MVEVNGALKHGRYDNIWLNGLRVMSNINVFAIQDGWPPAERAWLNKQIYNYIARMDQ